jgi:hypothetical protein
VSIWARLVVLIAFVMVLPAPALALARQNNDEPVSTEAARYLPVADQFGPDWSVARTAPLEVDTDVFRDGAVVVLSGPNGARVIAVAMLVTQERVAIRRSWEAAMSLYDNYSGELEYLAGRDDELDTAPPPEGCVEAKRIDGTARQLGIDTGIPMGVTLCAAEPDLIVLAVASGTVFGLIGFEASDAIAALLTSARSDATPAT